MNQPLLSVNNLTHLYAPGKGFSDVSLIYGRGSAGHCRGIRLREDHAAEVDLRAPDAAAGEIHYENRSLYAMSEADRRRLLRTEWGVVHQHPLDGLRRRCRQAAISASG